MKTLIGALVFGIIMTINWTKLRIWVFKRFKTIPLSKKQIYFCFILWTFTSAFGIAIEDYTIEVVYGNINQFGKIPFDSILNGIIGGLFLGGIVLGISYIISYLFSLFDSSSKITVQKIFCVITILYTAFHLYIYVPKFIDIINYDKENIENIRQKMEEYKNDYY